ncbi:MAG: hypothetical protein WB810_00040 [Candidatus Cybelea sp.]
MESVSSIGSIDDLPRSSVAIAENRVRNRIAAEPNPAVRLLLGSDAVAVASAANTERQRVDEQWRTVSLSTDFDGLAPFDKTSLAQIVTTA